MHESGRLEEAMHREGSLEYGPVYRAIERALWALGPALILLIVLGYPSQEAARQQITADQAVEIAAENARYCENWGMLAGSVGHADCIRDLVAIRERAEQRVRDQIAADF
jgi:hypothetical protein